MYYVLKSSLDGLSGGASRFASLDDALREIYCYHGWPSLEALHANIRQWAEKAQPGDVYCTQVSALVVARRPPQTATYPCTRCGGSLIYGEVRLIHSFPHDLLYRVTCDGCGDSYEEVFTWVGHTKPPA